MGTSGEITAILCQPAVVPKRPTVAGALGHFGTAPPALDPDPSVLGRLPCHLRGLLVAQVTRVRATYLETREVRDG
jgi:hypothetical protein